MPTFSVDVFGSPHQLKKLSGSAHVHYFLSSADFFSKLTISKTFSLEQYNNTIQYNTKVLFCNEGHRPIIQNSHITVLTRSGKLIVYM